MFTRCFNPIKFWRIFNFWKYYFWNNNDIELFFDIEKWNIVGISFRDIEMPYSTNRFLASM